MWGFFSRAPRREAPTIKMPDAVSVPRQKETLAAQVDLAEARVSHLITAEDIRTQRSEHASLVDDTLAAFGKARHARH